MSRLYALIIVLVLGLGLTAHSQNLKQCLKYAKENSELGNHYGAIQFYEKAMQYDSASIDILYNYALELKNYYNYEKAAYYFEKVLDKGKGKIHPESVFWLAVMQKNLGDYREAGRTWKQVRRILGRNRKSYYAQKSKQEIKSCSWAYKTQRDSTDWEISSSAINTYNSEFAPFIHNDKLYFASLRANVDSTSYVVKDDLYKIKIYASENLKDPAVLDTTINSPTCDNGEAALTPDGTRMYFTRCLPGERCQIYISRKEGDSWSIPEKLGVINENGFASVQPYLAEIDGQEYLFFASDREGGEGGLDIYYSQVSQNGNKYSKPKNAGRSVNTLDDEISPYYDSEEGRLYFSSTWHMGYGGMDVFYSTGKPGKFSGPRNAGKPTNSPANDIYYKKAKRNKAFVVSNRKGSKSSPHPTCCNDIFELTIPEVIEEDTLEYATLEDLNRFLPVTLYFHNDRPNPNSLDTSTSLNYLATYESYTDLIPKYKTEYSSGLSQQEAEQAKLDIEDFFIDYVEKGVSDLETFTKLLLVELEKGLKIEMTVQGYASPLAATEYNVKLTYRRISSMINYLRNYQDGVLAPYIDHTAENGGSLSFVQIPFGEYTADQQISDNPNDQQESVYSIRAALERKIEIQSVQIANESDSSYAEIKFLKEVHNFGVLESENSLECTFTFENVGNADLTIEHISWDCDCISVDRSGNTLAPGEKDKITVQLDPTGKKGKNMVPFTVITNGFPKEKKLSVTFDLP